MEASSAMLYRPRLMTCSSPFSHPAGAVRCLLERAHRPSPEKKDMTHIPYKVQRTPSGNLPVYPLIRNHGTYVTTKVRKVFGDIHAFRKELQTVCEAPVRIRAGLLEIKGLHVLKVKGWLTSLGF
ncbi:unnamed protein product [Vitrella brassicaformis CCMP3155]|uniref:Large ribosomal subunit protein mL49 n=2 Tax=Vitrella brassicaformis TaxID=1169539 RepID=A0A0G4EBC2_VITBC|nr:unnamed protein product [Vitrella brassicaformis CCMP3155]|eukprot:CEL92571.1 unnamed protein product [Vitrella brassicaformis CCMP3155]